MTKEERREYEREWREKNRDKVNAYKRKWEQKPENIEKRRAYAKKWYAEHAEEQREKGRRRYYEKAIAKWRNEQ